jgi:hypothetical protein
MQWRGDRVDEQANDYLSEKPRDEYPPLLRKACGVESMVEPGPVAIRAVS